MLILLSPAKSLDYETPPVTPHFTQPQFLAQSQALIDILRQKSPQEIASLMSISDKLSALNTGRYQSWSLPFTPQNSKQAALAFNGDVYDGLQANNLSSNSLEWLQHHVRILSGLYGVLRPLDLIQAYRLEMGTRLKHKTGNDLYAYWRAQLTQHLQTELQQQSHSVVLNCASEEYSTAINFKALDVPVIQPIFKDWKNGSYKIISFYAKKARGLFTRYAAEGSAHLHEDLKCFDREGYQYSEEESTAGQWVFLRKVVVT